MSGSDVDNAAQPGNKPHAPSLPATTSLLGLTGAGHYVQDKFKSWQMAIKGRVLPRRARSETFSQSNMPREHLEMLGRRNPATPTDTRIQVLVQFVNEISSKLDRNTLIKKITDRVPDLLDCVRCTFFTVDHATKELVALRHLSRGRVSLRKDSAESCESKSELPFEKGRDEIRLPMTKGLAGYVATSGHPLKVDHVSLDSRFSNDMDQRTKFETRNMLVVPVVDSHTDVVLGVLQAINKRKRSGPFTNEDLTLFEMFAKSASISLTNTRLFEESEQNLRESQAQLVISQALIGENVKLDRLVQIIVSKLQSLLDVDRVTMFILDSKKELYTNSKMSVGVRGKELPIPFQREDRIRVSREKGLVGAALRAGELINVPDAYLDPRFDKTMDQKTGFRTRNLLVMPIKHHNECAGVIQVINKRRGRFTMKDEKLLRNFGSQIAIAVRNSRLFEETEKALNQSRMELRNLKYMLKISKSLTGFGQGRDMMRQMLVQLRDLIPCDYHTLFLIDSDESSHSRSTQSSYFNVGSENEKERFPTSKGIVGFVIRTRRAVHLDKGVDRDVRFNPTSDTGGFDDFKSLLCIPITENSLSSRGNRSPSYHHEDKRHSSSNAKERDDEDGEVDERQLKKRPKILGAALVASRRSKSITKEHEKLLRVFATQASIALTNAQKVSRVLSEAAFRKADNTSVQYLQKQHKMKLGADEITSFEIKYSDLKLERSIGSGSFGEVFRGKLKGYPHDVAVKKLYAKTLKGDLIESFCSEASLMIQLNHPNLVRFIGAVTEPPNLCIVTEFCARGSLADILLEPSIEVPSDKKIQMLIDAARGMIYLHESNPIVVHRDLKSDNLMVMDDWSIKIGDFGLTRFFDEKNRMTKVGTPMWMAPEVILSKRYSARADVYSFGIIMWEVLTRDEPYDDLETLQIVIQVVNYDLRPRIPAVFKDTPFVQLMKECWDKNPDSRPTFRTVLQRLEAIQAAGQFTA